MITLRIFISGIARKDQSKSARSFKMVEFAKMKDTFDNTIFIAQWSMKLFGLWPGDSRYATARYFFFFLLSCGLFIHPYLYIAKNENVSIDDMFLIFASIPNISKFFFAKLKLRNYGIIVERMREDWHDFYDLSEGSKRIVSFYASKARRMSVIYIVCTILSYFAFILAPINGGTSTLRLNFTLKNLPAEGWFPFDEKQSPLFEITYITQTIQTFFLCTMNLATDSFLSVAVLHACGQLAVLSKIINDYTGVIKHNEIDRNNKECACMSCIVTCHVSLIKYINIIEDSFSGMILFQLFGNSALLSMEGYLSVVHAEKNDFSGIVQYTTYAISATYILFIYCYLGEYIIEQADNVGNTAYNLEWYKLSSKSASPLILLIRSGFSCKITAGRFFVMRLSYYKKIITTSMSYISVLKAIK